jgi:cell shape-determining protein MreD
MGDTRERKIEEWLLREAIVLVIVVGLALAQMALVGVPFLGYPLPLVLIVVLCRALVALESPMPVLGVETAMRGAVYGGIVLDIGSGMPFGAHMLALLLAMLPIVAILARLQVSGVLVVLLAVLPATIIYEAVLAGFYHVLIANLDWQTYAVAVLLPSVLVTLLPVLPVFYFLRWRLKA